MLDGNIEYTEEELKYLKEIFQLVKETKEKTPDVSIQYRAILDELALAGWYMDYGLPLSTVAKLILLDYQNKTHLDDYLIKYFKRKLTIISKNILSTYPKRKNILNAAFKAHNNKLYELSIPTILSQVDGICYDLIEKNIFSRGRENKKNTPNNIPQHWIEQLNIDIVRMSFLEPLRNNKYLSANFEESKMYPHVLNRNKILHGRDVNYATERNSYKAISLLNYITTVVEDITRNDGKLTFL